MECSARPSAYATDLPPVVDDAEHVERIRRRSDWAALLQPDPLTEQATQVARSLTACWLCAQSGDFMRVVDVQTLRARMRKAHPV